MYHHGDQVRVDWAVCSGGSAGSCWVGVSSHRQKGKPSSPAMTGHTAQSCSCCHCTSPCISSLGTQFNQPQGLWEAGMPMGVRNVLLIARGLSHLQKRPMSRAASARAVHAHAVQNQQPEVSVSIPELDAE